MLNRIFQYIKTLAKRTLIGADGTTYHRAGVVGYILDVAEAALGFFTLIVLPGMLGALAWHWLFD